MSFDSIVRRSTYLELGSTFQDLLNGETAFYEDENYVLSTRHDFFAKKPLPAIYSCDTEHKALRIVKNVLTVIVFPKGAYRLLQSLAGKVALLPASAPKLWMFGSYYANDHRFLIGLKTEWKYKRFTVAVDGLSIDAMIVGRDTTLSNRRWLLYSNSNGTFYEALLHESKKFRNMLTEVNSNAIVFNYPGVGASTGLANRKVMVKSYRAMLNFLEDQVGGIGAKEIIGYGHSIGGGVQGHALRTHPLKDDIQYVFVKDRTFSSLSTAASSITTKKLGTLVKLLKWNFDSVESSKSLQAPEIIMQTADVEATQVIEDGSFITHDGLLPPEATLAKVLLEDEECPKDNKIFIGLIERHNEPMENTTLLTTKINELLIQ